MAGNRVGIGNTDPQFTLDITGDINVTGGLFSNGQDVSGALYWAETETENIVTGVNVGIGVTEPSEKLHVSGNVKIDSGEVIQNGVSIGFGSSTIIDIEPSTTILDPNRLYNFVTYRTESTATDLRTTEWATRITGAGSEEGKGVATDAEGNVYVTGYYSSNPPVVYNADGSLGNSLSILENSEDFAAFVVKYNSSGTAQWATRIDGTGTDAGYGIATDSNGNVYVTGYYLTSSVTIFNAGGSTFGTLANSGSFAGFIVKYNSAGIAQWATRIDGTGDDVGFGIATDATGNVYVTGRYTGTVTVFNAGGTSFGTLANSGSFAAFVVKYNTSGTAQWATRIDGTGADVGHGIATDADGNVYVTGYYTGTVTIFNAGGTSFGTLANSGGNAAFVVKYNTTGSAQWATRIDGTGNDQGWGIATDATGNVYVTGYYAGTVTIFNAGGTSFGTLANSGSFAAYVVKYNTSGTAQWATRIDGTSSNSGQGIATDATGNVYVTGYYQGTVTIFNAGGTSFGTLANSGSNAAFVVKYNTSGAAQWATRIDGTSDDVGFGIATDSNGNVYVTGRYTGAAIVRNPDGSTFGTLTSDGSREAFIVKINDTGFLEIPYELPLLDNTPLNQGRAITVVNKSETAPTIKVLNTPLENVPVPVSRKFLYYDNKWYAM
jgi:sugar lactone lactonase YvrE